MALNVNLDQATLVSYFAVMLLVGLYFSRRHSDSESFLLADRNLGVVHVAGSSFSTFVGAGLLFFMASLGFQYGVSAFSIILAAVVGFIVFLRFSSKIHDRSEETESVTLPQMLEKSWDRRTRMLASVILVLLFSAATAAQFIVAGTVLNQVFGFPVTRSAVAFGGLVILYTGLGGFKSVTWSDIIQMAIIIAGTFFALLPLAVIEHWSAVASLPASHLTRFSMPPAVFVAYLLMGIFAYYGSQDLFQRVYASRTHDHARKGLLAFGGLMLALAAVSIFLGMAARAVVPSAGADQALPALTAGIVPAGLTGLVLAAFISMANSSADSQLLTVSSNLLEDIVKKRFDLSQERELLGNRALVVGVGVMALGTVVLIPSLRSVFNSIGSWLAILGFAVFATLKWEISSRSAFLSMIAGFGTANLYSATTGNFQASALLGILASAVAVATSEIDERWRSTGLQ